MDLSWPSVTDLTWYKEKVLSMKPAQEAKGEPDGEDEEWAEPCAADSSVEYDAVKAAQSVYSRYLEGDAVEGNDWAAIVLPHYQRMNVHFWLQKGTRSAEFCACPARLCCPRCVRLICVWQMRKFGL